MAGSRGRRPNSVRIDIAYLARSMARVILGALTFIVISGFPGVV